MMRFLLKPLVYLLVFGLLGCTSTKWASMDQPAVDEPLDLIRVTLVGGDQIVLRDATVTDESVSGLKDDKNRYARTPFTVAADSIQSVEIGDRKTNAGKTFLYVVIVPILILTVVVAVACDINDDPNGCWAN